MKEPEIINSFELDQFFNMQRGKMSFPSLYVDGYGDEFAILFDGLPEGNLPVVLRVEDKLIEIGKVKKDLEIINRLVKFYETHWIVSDDERIPLTNIENLLDIKVDWS